MFLFRSIIFLVVGLIQWMFVINAVVVLLIYPHTHSAPISPRLYELAVPGCLVVAWWTYRLLFRRTRRVAR
jgi:hypothetical protein